MKIIRTAALVAAATAAYSKAREYARDNPAKASETIDKAESFVRGKAGPKYADKVGKGSEALRKGLGLSAGAAGASPSSTTGGSSAEPSAPSPSSTTDGSGRAAPSQGFDPAI